MKKQKRDAELTSKDLCDSNFGGFIKVVWNGKEVFEDLDDGLHINGNWDPVDNVQEAINKFISDYSDKLIYNFYCRVTAYHHTELYIEGED